MSLRQIRPMHSALIVMSLLLQGVVGCASTSWHMHPVKWSRVVPVSSRDGDLDEREEPTDLRERCRGTARRIWDNEDTDDHEGKFGVYTGGASTIGDYSVASGSMGLFSMPTSWSTVRGGVFGMDRDGIGVGGFEGQVRVHTPTRIAPYVGLSGEAGLSGLSNGYAQRQPNPQHLQRTTTLAGIAAVTPEAGVSYWLNSSTRLNAGVGYAFAARQTDFLTVGASVEFVTGDEPLLRGFRKP